MATRQKESRANVISAVQTPLGFFTLCTLVMEGGLGVVAVRLDSANQAYALWGMLGCIILLIVVVAIIGLRRPHVLTQPTLGFNISQDRSLSDLIEVVTTLRSERENSVAIRRYDDKLVMEGDFLRITSTPLEDIKAIIIPVSADRDLENLWAHQCLVKLAAVSSKDNRRYVWLLHDDVSADTNTAYHNTGLLQSKFNSESIRIIPKYIEHIRDVKQVYNIILRIADELPDHNLKPEEIFCDNTAGTKAISIGMTLACLGRMRLVWWPHSNDNRYYWKLKPTPNLICLQAAMASKVM